MLTIVKHPEMGIINTFWGLLEQMLTPADAKTFHKANMVVYDHAGNQFFMTVRQLDGTYRTLTFQGKTNLSA